MIIAEKNTSYLILSPHTKIKPLISQVKPLFTTISQAKPPISPLIKYTNISGQTTTILVKNINISGKTINFSLDAIETINTPGKFTNISGRTISISDKAIIISSKNISLIYTSLGITIIHSKTKETSYSGHVSVSTFRWLNILYNVNSLKMSEKLWNFSFLKRYMYGMIE